VLEAEHAHVGQAWVGRFHDPKSIDFCERIVLGYVSCSPFRVPIARVAAAQAALRRTKKYWH
jgi:phosphoenolpyruvate synthase/pyruvate phosphate dikinase